MWGQFVVLIAGLIVAQERVENPHYASWAKFKPGTAVTRIENAVDAEGNIIRVTKLTDTLVEVAADKLVIEMEYLETTPGKPKIKTKPRKLEIPKIVPLPPGVTKAEFQKLPGTVDEGAETVVVAAGEFKTSWYKTKETQKSGEVEAKTWVADDVPGRVVKREATIKGATEWTSSTQVIEIKQP